MISYSTTHPLKVSRTDAPSPPYWQAMTVAPYSASRSKPVAIDYLALTATSPSRVEATVCNDPADQLDRVRKIDPPLLIEAAEESESIFRRGEAILDWAERNSAASTILVSTEGAIPRVRPGEDFVVAIAAWPAAVDKIAALLREACTGGWRAGVLLPLVFPVTTDLSLITAMADAAAEAGAEFLTGVAVDLFPAAKHAIAETLQSDPEAYDALFHSDLETISIATERHVAALAAERKMKDHVTLPGRLRSNWAAAAELARAGGRLIRMQKNSELGWDLVRSSRVVATLNKPIELVAKSASLSIIDALDEFSVSALGDWLENGSSSELDAIDAEWRLRRDYVVDTD